MGVDLLDLGLRRPCAALSPTLRVVPGRRAYRGRRADEVHALPIRPADEVSVLRGRRVTGAGRRDPFEP